MDITNDISSVNHTCESGIGYSFVFYLAGLDTCFGKGKVDQSHKNSVCLKIETEIFINDRH